MARSDREWIAWRGVFSAIQPKLALLDRADTAHRRDLVFRRELTTALAAQSLARLSRRNCFFHRHVWLARRARRFVSMLFFARTLVAALDLSGAGFRLLELVHRMDKTRRFHRFVAKLARRIRGRVRVGHA